MRKWLISVLRDAVFLFASFHNRLLLHISYQFASFCEFVKWSKILESLFGYSVFIVDKNTFLIQMMNTHIFIYALLFEKISGMTLWIAHDKLWSLSHYFEWLYMIFWRNKVFLSEILSYERMQEREACDIIVATLAVHLKNCMSRKTIAFVSDESLIQLFIVIKYLG